MSQISVVLAFPVIQAMKSAGVPIHRLLTGLPLQERLLADPEARITYNQYDQLFEQAANLSGNPLFGLELGASYSLDNMGLVGWILLHSATIRQAFENYERYNLILCSGIRYELRLHGSDAVIAFRVTDPARRPSYHLTDSLLASTYQIIQKLAGEKLALKRASFTQERSSNDASYRKLFQCELLYGQTETLLVFDASVLSLPILYQNRQLLQMMEAHAADVMRSLNLEHSFAELVCNEVLRKFDGHIPRLSEISHALGMSVRVVQLKLKEEGLTYRELIATVRGKMAEGYLRNPSFTIPDIAYALGFSEPRAFHFAFKKWTGQTPSQYRRQLLRT